MKRAMTICAAMGLLAGCASSPENSYYVLSEAPPAGNHTARTIDVSVASVRLPGVLDRTQLVVRTGAQTVEIREFERWAEPLADMVPRVLARDLALRAGTGKTETTKRRLIVVVDDFIVDKGGAAHLTGRWWFADRKDDPGAAPGRSFSLTRPGDGSEGPHVAAAMSVLLGMLADDILED